MVVVSGAGLHSAAQRFFDRKGVFGWAGVGS